MKRGKMDAELTIQAVGQIAGAGATVVLTAHTLWCLGLVHQEKHRRQGSIYRGIDF